MEGSCSVPFGGESARRLIRRSTADAMRIIYKSSAVNAALESFCILPGLIDANFNSLSKLQYGLKDPQKSRSSIEMGNLSV